MDYLQLDMLLSLQPPYKLQETTLAQGAAEARCDATTRSEDPFTAAAEAFHHEADGAGSRAQQRYVSGAFAVHQR
jgi:hypothetical protein